MKKIYLINFSLMEKLADKKRLSTEDAAAFITGVELFFLLLVVECIIMKLLPFQLHDIIIYGGIALIGYFTHYPMRTLFRKAMIRLGTRKTYTALSKGKRRWYVALSIFNFFFVFLFFFAMAVATIGAYYKRWE